MSQFKFKQMAEFELLLLSKIDILLAQLDEFSRNGEAFNTYKIEQGIISLFKYHRIYKKCLNVCSIES